LVVPQVRSFNDAGGEFLIAEFFPNPSGTNAFASELFARVTGRTNLAYYGWENTTARLAQWRGLSQLVLMLAKQPQLDADSASAKWLDAVGAQLAQSVTEATVRGTNQVTVQRTSAIGLTAFEMVALANWIESPSFPLCGYRLPAHNRTPTAAAPAANSTHVETRTEH
jgi:hypothetical protein